MSTRLTMLVKNGIKRRLLDDVMKQKADDIQKMGHELAYDIYVQSIGENNIELMKKLPQGYFIAQSGVNFAIKGDNYNKTLFLDCARLIPAQMQYGFLIELDDYPELLKRYLAFEQMKNDHAEQRRKLTQKINSIMASVTTTKRLVEIWPEGEKYLPETEKKSTHLPAVQVADLNKMIEEFKK